MNTLYRIPYQNALPGSFFAIPSSASEAPTYVSNLFRMESDRNEIVLYTDHRTIRLVGIFPHDSTEALFGFWETTDDLPLNRRAFAMLEADAQERGRVVVVGPLNFNTFHAYRLRLTDAPSWGRFDREPAKPAYYPALLKQLGFRVRSRFASRLIRSNAIPFAYDTKQQLLAGLSQLPFDIIPLNPDTWRQHEAELFALVHPIFGANPAYKPISDAQFRLLYNQQYAEKLCPHSSVLFRDRALGQLVAMSFCHPNYQLPGTEPDERPVFERDFPRLAKKVLLVRSVGVHPAYRKLGLMSFLGAYGMLHFRELYEEVIFCLMRADNFSLHFSNDMDYEEAEYGLFEKVLSISK
ncbi:MAG: hypothetical protein LH609_21630 [Rudanella sp.]|nr:hypothetical protein [Rudanella sp.]